MIKAVVFDLDGTLADTEPLHEIARGNLLKSLGVYSKELSNSAIGISKRVFWNGVKEKFNLSLDAEKLTILEFKELLPIIKQKNIGLTVGGKELLEFLYKNGIKMAVASSSDEFYVDGVLEHLGIKKYFSAVVGGDKVERAKPYPDVYLKALSSLGVESKDAIAVEDSTTGMKSAKNAGLTTILCEANEIHLAYDYSLADKRVKNLSEIIDYIKD